MSVPASPSLRETVDPALFNLWSTLDIALDDGIDIDRTAILEVRRDAWSVLYRCRRASLLQTMLVAVGADKRAPVESVRRVEHVFALRQSLDLGFAPVPRKLIRLDGSASLLFDDPGGDALLPVRGQPWSLPAFLAASAALFEAIGRMHSQDVLHRDLRPPNLLVANDGRVALTGFCAAARIGSEPALDGQPAVAPESWPYMSPEQTGRMNRPVDGRSDLYSAGVVIYELLTGVLPFEAEDLFGWTHQHVAVEAISPSERDPSLPRQLSRIVLRLLRKTPESRYQTGEGVANDLRRCQAQWLASGTVDDFPLGEQDVPDRLVLTGLLCGREAEIAMLLETHARVAAGGVTELVLVSGYSGVGKSTVVSALQSALLPEGGRFVSGKFEQHKRDIPYATLTQILKTLVADLLGLNDGQLAPWRRRLSEALGENGQLVVGLVPELELLIGKQPALREIAATETARRFHVTVHRFLLAFTASGSPLVLFIDDLQWLDAATLALLQYLATAGSHSAAPLMLIGAYRDNEVDASHPLSAMRDRLRAAGVSVQDVRLLPLDAEHVHGLLGVALRETGSRVAALATLVHRKTRGNPFFLLQFIAELEAQRMLRFDRTRRQWSWDLEDIEARGYSDNVADLMLERLQRLPEATRRLLQRVACLGAAAGLGTLAEVAQRPLAEIDAEAVIAERAGLVTRRAGSLRFLHDRIQEAAYALVPPDDRAVAHLQIARHLARADAERVEAGLFELVNQYMRGAAFISDDAERVRVARLHLRAARRAKADSAYVAALAYLVGGQQMLAPIVQPTAVDIDLRFNLGFARAECEFLTGQTRDAAATLATLEAQARGAVERGNVAALRVTVLLALDDSASAIDVGLGYLREDDSDWPRRPERAGAAREYARLLDAMEARPVRALFELPLMTDARKKAALDVATALLPPAFFSDENLVCVLLCRMAQISIAHGNTHASALAYAYLGMVLGPQFGDYDTGFEFGSLGLELVEHSPLSRYEGRVSMCFGSHVVPWARLVRSGQPYIRRALAACQEGGDVTYTSFSTCTLVTNMLAAGDDLKEVAREATSGLAFVRAAGFGLVVDIVTTQRQLVRSLLGSTSAIGSLDDDEFDEQKFEAHLQSNRSLDIAACWYWIRKAQARFMAGDCVQALDAIERAEPLLWTSIGHLELAEFHFYAGLVHASSADAQGTLTRASHLSALDAHRSRLALWARHCPANFAARASLLAAEQARLSGDSAGAMAGFETAASQAREAGVVPDEALALERLALHHEQLGMQRTAQALNREARDRYLAWGALAKVRQLDVRHGLDRKAEPSLGIASGTGPEAFDIAAVVRTAQAITAEVGLQRLMRRLMRIALAHSGAERGVLVRPHGDALRVEARAHVRGNDIDVELCSAPVDTVDLPTNMLFTAMRTRQAVLTDDAGAWPAQGGDGPASRRPGHSMLCLPLVKQSELIGLLYLENRLATHVFTPARVAVLTLLAATAALSMDNAALEEKESLLKEVHHRVKNNLQLISSMLSLQAMRLEDPAVAALFSDSCHRLRSMALVHENLYRAGNFARVPMASHIQNLCAQLVRAYGLEAQRVSLDVQTDDIHLDLDRAVSCGLIVNELVSNSLKHAFVAGRAGSIRVRLLARGEGRCELSVTDDGVGLPDGIDVQAAGTLGLQLVGDLTAQLRGRLDADTRVGTRWTIDFESQSQQEAA